MSTALAMAGLSFKLRRRYYLPSSILQCPNGLSNRSYAMNDPKVEQAIEDLIEALRILAGDEYHDTLNTSNPDPKVEQPSKPLETYKTKLSKP